MKRPNHIEKRRYRMPVYKSGKDKPYKKYIFFIQRPNLSTFTWLEVLKKRPELSKNITEKPPSVQSLLPYGSPLLKNAVSPGAIGKSVRINEELSMVGMLFEAGIKNILAYEGLLEAKLQKAV